MSENNHAASQDELHIGPFKVSKQSLLTVVFSFLIPVLVIASLILALRSADKAPTGVVTEEATAASIQKVGSLEIQGAARELKTGEQVYAAQCTLCHKSGISGAPKFGDSGAWAPRVATGFTALLNSALKGKNAMGAQGGGAFSDFEVARAVVYMANAGGAKFAEPKNPADDSSK